MEGLKEGDECEKTMSVGGSTPGMQAELTERRGGGEEARGRNADNKTITQRDETRRRSNSETESDKGEGEEVRKGKG